MTYSLMVRRVMVRDQGHVYIYGLDDDIAGHLTVDVGLGRIYSSDDQGQAVGSAFVTTDGSEFGTGDLQGDQWQAFLKASASLIKKLREDREPPDTAHRFFA